MVNEIDNFFSNPEVLNKLRADFIKYQHQTAQNIYNALDAGDIKTAHRLAHSLKSLAALIQENALASYAQTLEDNLRDFSITKSDIPAHMLDNMEAELNIVLKKISKPQSSAEPLVLDSAKAAQTLIELQPLLVGRNIQSISHVAELRTIPGAEKLAELVEAFEFAKAAQELKTVRELLKI